MEKESIITLQKKIHKELIKELKHFLRPYDLKASELPVLIKLIKHGDGLTQKQLLKKLPVSKSTLSKTINDLIKKGYLRKTKKSDDRRANLIYLTDKSSEIEKVIQEIHKKSEKMMLQDFDEKEREKLIHYLKKILSNLKDQKNGLEK